MNGDATAATTSQGRDPEVGDVVDGRYVLRREIARGGMGIVSEVRHSVLGRTAAIKILHKSYQHRDVTRKRLLREGRALILANAEGIVRVEDAGVCQTFGPYVVMEMLEGRTLDGILAARSRLQIEEALSIGDQLCRAIHAAHACSVVHRDIKPSNVFLCPGADGEEHVKIIDFSIAKVANDAETVREKLTIPGEIVGTFDYMSPEQLLAQEDIDLRADIYSIAAMLFECITGRVPYAGGYQGIVRKLVRNEPSPVVSEFCKEVPPHVNDAIARALSSDREQRFASAEEFRVAFLGSSPQWKTALLWGGPPVRAGDLVPRPAPAAQVQSRREYERAPYQTHVRIKDAEGKYILCRTEDISEGGVMVFGRSPFPSGADVAVQLALPMLVEPINVVARVQWAKESRGRHIAGLRFVNLPASAAGAIGEYVKGFARLAGRATTNT